MMSIGNGKLVKPEGTILTSYDSALSDLSTADMVGELSRRLGVVSFEICPDGRGKVASDDPG